MKNITIRLEEKTIETLKAVASKENRTLSAMIRLILKEHIKCKK